MNNLIQKIKLSEGFVATTYKDHLGFDTIGFGTKLPLSQDEAELILKHRLNSKISSILQAKPIVLTLTQDRQEVIFEMVYQLGVRGCLNFKKMWAAIEAGDFMEAAHQMQDSRWYRQTPNRVERLMKDMRGVRIPNAENRYS